LVASEDDQFRPKHLDTLNGEFILYILKMYLSKINSYMPYVNFMRVSASCLLEFLPDLENGGRTSF
jgi:hypothetical protein